LRITMDDQTLKKVSPELKVHNSLIHKSLKWY
jgi:hypothetical protein